MKRQAVTPLTIALIVALLASVYVLWIRPLQSKGSVEVVFEDSVVSSTNATQKK